MNSSAEVEASRWSFNPAAPEDGKLARAHEAQLYEEVARGEQLGFDVAMIPLDKKPSYLMPYLVTEGVRAVMHMRI